MILKTKIREKVRVKASPNLALLKYWGKIDGGVNIPATTSLGLTLNRLYSETEVIFDKRIAEDRVYLSGKEQPYERFRDFFEAVRKEAERVRREPFRGAFEVRSRNNFPTAAGIASSSAGFAALALGCMSVLHIPSDSFTLSRLARIGSGSAARAVYEGFSLLAAGSGAAVPFRPKNFWPELRVLVLLINRNEKTISSRRAMEISKLHSPFYQVWRSSSERLVPLAKAALLQKKLRLLGPYIRQSYLRMFSVMMSGTEPVLYWDPRSLGVIRLCEKLRNRGLTVWETMDAGPQVKLFCHAREVRLIHKELSRYFPPSDMLLSAPGDAPRLLDTEE